MKKQILFIILGGSGGVLILLVAAFILFRPTNSEIFSSTVKMPPAKAGFVLTSPDFSDGDPIPARYTCDGENIPPTLAWGEPPAGTVSIFLFVEDPVAPGGTWTHWIVYNLPRSTSVVDAQFKPGVRIDDNPILFGKNSWGTEGYRGPCPPAGAHHHYIFSVDALDIMLGAGDKSSRNDLVNKMQGHILGTATLMGTYSR